MNTDIEKLLAFTMLFADDDENIYFGVDMAGDNDDKTQYLQPFEMETQLQNNDYGRDYIESLTNDQIRDLYTQTFFS